MRGLLRELSVQYANSEDGNHKLRFYLDLKTTEGWKAHQELLLMIRGKMAEELLSERFSRLDKEEKDAKQRAYHYTDEIIRFLLNPLELAIRRAEFVKQFDKRMGMTSGK